MVEQSFQSIAVQGEILLASKNRSVVKGALQSGALFVSGGKLYIQGETDVECVGDQTA